MKWHQQPAVVDQLAASYVLGTLQGRARHRFEMVMQSRADVAAAVAQWSGRLSAMHEQLPAIEPKPSLWKAIEKRTQPKTSLLVLPWWQHLLSPIPAGALSIGIALGVVAPAMWQAQTIGQRQTQLPESYVGVLATAQGKTGLIVSSLRKGKVVEFQQATLPTLQANQTLHLWRIDKEGQITTVGAIPNEKWSQVILKDPAETIFLTATELAVSIEQIGNAPSAPSQPFLYRGLCGKLWKWK
jgi:anti-sigma-K factor RskA